MRDFTEPLLALDVYGSLRTGQGGVPTGTRRPNHNGCTFTLRMLAKLRYDYAFEFRSGLQNPFGHGCLTQCEALLSKKR
jgi:hypothetical protein